MTLFSNPAPARSDLARSNLAAPAAEAAPTPGPRHRSSPTARC